MSERRPKTRNEHTTERRFAVQGEGATLLFYGEADTHLKALREAFGLRVSGRGGELRVSGPPEAVKAAAGVIEKLAAKAEANRAIEPAELAEWIEAVLGAATPGTSEARYHGLVKARSPGQEKYLQSMKRNDLVFALGPAGTGKTYLAVAQGVSALRSGRARRLVLTRPAVEAGEHLGFLPGDFEAKINPYLRPLYDALHDFLPVGEVRRNLDRDVFEIAPLAYMRGRTLNGAVVILDEGQNTTVTQMKMFLTRLGADSQMIVTGDTTQVDLPGGTRSGLLHAARLLDGVEGVGVVRLGKADIVRHPLVQRVVDAYTIAERREAEEHAPGGLPSGSDA
jgi:phosphate starvation-inducible PhoH-like protein